jgi:microcystin-dependent protein
MKKLFLFLLLFPSLSFATSGLQLWTSSITLLGDVYGDGSHLSGVVSAPNTITSSLTVTGSANGYGLSVSSNVYIVGYSSAAKYYGDGSSLTGVQTGGSISTVTIDALPIGTFIQYGSTTAPSSYLYCDGTSYSTTTYSALYAVIGYKYGGSGANFTCDFRGMFARGLDTTGTIDSEARVIGSSETDKFQGHNTTIVDPGHAHSKTLPISNQIGGVINWFAGNGSGGNQINTTDSSTTGITATTPITNGTNGTPRTGNETRPKNIAVAVMVKYQNPVVNYNGLTSSNTWSGSNTFAATGTGNVSISSLTVGALQVTGGINTNSIEVIDTACSGTVTGCNAVCSSGKQLMGGGCYVTSNGTSILNATHPDITYPKTQWACLYTSALPNIHAMAICLSIK